MGMSPVDDHLLVSISNKPHTKTIYIIFRKKEDNTSALEQEIWKV